MNSINPSNVTQGHSEDKISQAPVRAKFDPRDLIKLEQLKNAHQETAVEWERVTTLFTTAFGVVPEWKEMVTNRTASQSLNSEVGEAHAQITGEPVHFAGERTSTSSVDEALANTGSAGASANDDVLIGSLTENKVPAGELPAPIQTETLNGESSVPRNLSVDSESAEIDVEDKALDVLEAGIPAGLHVLQSQTSAPRAEVRNSPTRADGSPENSSKLGSDIVSDLEALKEVVQLRPSSFSTKDLALIDSLLSKLSATPNHSQTHPASQGGDSEAEPQTLGAGILASLMSHSQVAQSVAPLHVAQTNVTPQAADELNLLVQQMVDRLLVGDVRFQNKGEVHMKISDSILPQTELKIWRGVGGQLNVEFLSNSAEANEMLIAKLPQLTQRLNEQFANQSHSLPVQVSLNHQNQDEMPRDGRSRQQYVPLPQEEGEV